MFGINPNLSLLVVHDLFRSRELGFAAVAFGRYVDRQLWIVLFNTLVAAVEIGGAVSRNIPSQMRCLEQTVVMLSARYGISNMDDEAWFGGRYLGFQGEPFFLARMVFVPLSFLFRTRNRLFGGIHQEFIKVRNDLLELCQTPNLFPAALPRVLEHVLALQERDDLGNGTGDRTLIHSEEMLENKKYQIKLGPNQNQEQLIGKGRQTVFSAAAFLSFPLRTVRIQTFLTLFLGDRLEEKDETVELLYCETCERTKLFWP